MDDTTKVQIFDFITANNRLQTIDNGYELMIAKCNLCPSYHVTMIHNGDNITEKYFNCNDMISCQHCGKSFCNKHLSGNIVKVFSGDIEDHLLLNEICPECKDDYFAKHFLPSVKTYSLEEIIARWPEYLSSDYNYFDSVNNMFRDSTDVE